MSVNNPICKFCGHPKSKHGDSGCKEDCNCHKRYKIWRKDNLK